MARTRAEREAALRQRPRRGKRRSKGPRVFRETPSKRSLRGAQKIARQDQERGVTSRARKSREGRETVPDPRYGGRPGRRSTKWQPPRAARRPPPVAPTRAATHRIRVTLPEHLYERLIRIVAAERTRRGNARLSPADKIAELIEGYEARVS